MRCSRRAGDLLPPGYPGFLGILYWAFGSHAAVGQAANVLLTILNAGLVFFVARNTTGSNVALAAAGLYAFLPSNAMFPSLLYSEPLFTTLLLLILLFALRGASPIILGVVIGPSALVRGQGLILLLPLAVFAGLQRGWRTSVTRYALPMGVAAVVVLVPWTIRNYVEFDTFTLISTGHGDALWRGNREGVRGPPMPPIYPRPRDEDPIDAYHAKMEESLRFIRENPVSFFVTLPPRKLYYMYDKDDFHVSANQVASPHRDNNVAWRVISQVTSFGYFGTLALAAVAAPLWIRRNPAAVLLMVTFGAWTLLHLAFFGYARFHFPIMPIWAIWAGTGIAALWRRECSPQPDAPT